MVRHDFAQQSLKSLAVVGMHKVAKFMGDYVVDAGTRRPDKVARQHHVSAIGEAAPAMSEVTNDQPRQRRAIGGEWLKECREPRWVEGLCLVLSPSSQEPRALFAAIGSVHAENEA